MPSVRCEIRPRADGSQLVQFQGKVEAGHYVQSSDDLKTWTVVSDELVGSAGWTKWVDARPASTGQRFYRVGPAYAAGVAAKRLPTTTELLLAAVNSGDNATVLAILRANGVSDATLATLAANLGKPTQRANLPEPFLKANFPLDRGLSTALEGRRAKGSNLEGLNGGKLHPLDWAGHVDSRKGGTH